MKVERWTVVLRTLPLVVAALAWPAWCGGAISENLLRNPDFAGATQASGVPAGWFRYGGGGQRQQIKLVELGAGQGKALLLEDGDATAEIGIQQTQPAVAGLIYEASVEGRGLPGASSHGAYIQLRFLPSHKFHQESLAATSEQFTRTAVRGTAPTGTTQAMVYFYTHQDPTPKLLLRKARLVSGVEPPPPPYPDPVPPVYTRLKELHLNTRLVAKGKPDMLIVTGHSGAYRAEAMQIQKAIAQRTGVQVEIVNDDDPRSAVPIQSNLIALGNRSTSAAIRKLYDLYYTLLDLKYPGAEGYEVRSLHNPFGDGRNVIFVGGSDAAGVKQGTEVLVRKISEAKGTAGEFALGRLMEIKLGRGLQVPTDIRKFETWEASKGYGSVGYFGWNSLSKRAAMYYMTGDEFHAKEFYRLAFPDEKAKQEIGDIDGEQIENKDAPLSGPYHYNAHMMILFWDLIKESPVFTDDQRLRVLNAFSQQLLHRKDEGIYTRNSPTGQVGSRHGQWSAVSLYCLGRYFQKDYPNPIWEHCVRAGKMAFEPLRHHGWIAGESDNLFWYNTGIAPIFTHLVLTGDRVPVENGVMRQLLRGQEILVTGRQPDSALNSAAISFLHQAAYVMQDGRFIRYRQRTGMDTEVLRLGQSFWPEEHLQPKEPDDLAGQWSIHPLPEPMWRARSTGFALGESFQFGSFRSASDAAGDFILIDGFNGASRNPYHTFAILELRLGGYTLLNGYRNQISTRMDGLVEPHTAMDAALKYREVIGSTALAVAEVPDMPYCHWRRALVQRVGKYALIIDDLKFRADSDNMEVQIQWETEHGPKVLPDGQIDFNAPIEVPARRTVKGGQVRTAEAMVTQRTGRVASMQWVGPVKKGSHRYFFSLVGIEPDAGTNSLACFRLGERDAALALPRPAVVTVGTNGLVHAELAVVAEDHLVAKALTRFTPPAGTVLLPIPISTDQPVDLEWDFAAGKLACLAQRDTVVRLAVAEGLRLDGKAMAVRAVPGGGVSFTLPAGRHLLEGARLSYLGMLSFRLADWLAQARTQRQTAKAAQSSSQIISLPSLKEAGTAKIGGSVTDLIVVGTGKATLIYAAEGRRIHVLDQDGKEVRVMETDGTIRMLRWWAETGLLLAGCVDEQVIAFDQKGGRKWVFTSVMDPAVFRAAKQYWFKTAPGHEGIHGLHTGVFLNGQSQAFVGSACTLEILDANGKLVKRLPQFWGQVSHFAIVNGQDGSLNLLASPKYNGVNQVAIINNRTLDPNPRGFDSVPAGSTHVSGWSSMNRQHLFYEDLDGDGEKEVISEINGTWNRVTVWTKAGKALYDASFGPGESIPVKNMRDLEVADLDGDGKKEILAATSAGLVVALDNRCRKLWARRLADAPVVMKCVKPSTQAKPWIIVGCESGTVMALNGNGQPMRDGRLDGTPTCIESTADPMGGQRVVFGTSKGEIKLFQAAE